MCGQEIQMLAANLEAVKGEIGKVMAPAFLAALAAFLSGLCLSGSIKQFHSPFFSISVFCGAFTIFVIFWTRRTVRGLITAKYSTSKTAKRSARQYVAFCICFALNSFTFGLDAAAPIRISSDGFSSYSAVFFGVLTCIWALCVRREARRLTSALV
jgi:hypothetical protein